MRVRKKLGEKSGIFVTFLTIPGVTECDGPLNNHLVQSHSKRQEGGRETHMKEYHAVMAVVHIIIAKYGLRK